jgi:hypothetical protein
MQPLLPPKPLLLLPKKLPPNKIFRLNVFDLNPGCPASGQFRFLSRV